MANWGQSSSEWQDPEANKLPEKVERLEANHEIPNTSNRKKVVVVGLGMVGISFMYVVGMRETQNEDANGYHSEKLMKYDVKRREYDVIVIGEEPHLAYNRVGLTSFFQHRKVENLYLNPKEWVCPGSGCMESRF